MVMFAANGCSEEAWGTKQNSSKTFFPSIRDFYILEHQTFSKNRHFACHPSVTAGPDSRLKKFRKRKKSKSQCYICSAEPKRQTFIFANRIETCESQNPQKSSAIITRPLNAGCSRCAWLVIVPCQICVVAKFSANSSVSPCPIPSTSLLETERIKTHLGLMRCVTVNKAPSTMQMPPTAT